MDQYQYYTLKLKKRSHDLDTINNRFKRIYGENTNKIDDNPWHESIQTFHHS